MKYRFVIWDWNGTLINDAHDSVDVVNRLLRKRALPDVTLEQYRELYTHPVKRIYEQLGFDLDDESWARLCDEWFEDYVSNVAVLKLHSDSLSILQAFKGFGCVQAVLSALPHELLLKSIDQHGLSPFFHTVSGLNDRLGISKVGNGNWVMERIHAVPATSVMIGDSSHDFEVAQHLGIDCLLVARGLESRRRLELNACPVFEDFAGLRDHIGAL